MCQTLLGKYHYFSCFIAYETEQLNYECFFLTIEKQRLKQGKLEGKGSSNSVIFFILSRVMFKHNKMKADFLGAVTLPMANIAKLGEQQAYQLTLVVKNPPANSGDARDVDLIPGLEGSPGGGNGTPLQYSCLKNFMDRGACQATVHGAIDSLSISSF